MLCPKRLALCLFNHQHFVDPPPSGLVLSALVRPRGKSRTCARYTKAILLARQSTPTCSLLQRTCHVGGYLGLNTLSTPLLAGEVQPC